MAIIDVVKYNGSSDVFAWKYPSEELGTWTQLIVNESQEAVLYKGGQALDLFKAGRHTLETANIPFLSNIVNLPFGGRSPFTAEVWYINKIHQLAIKWGTPTPIQLQDPKYKVFIPLRSFGQFGIQVDESRKFLTKLVGTLPVFDKENMLKYFKGLYLTKVKDSISSYLIKKSISVLEINAYLDELSEHLKERISPTLDEYGIKLINFYVNDINIPDDDPAVKKLKDALAKRAEMDIVGYNYIQERSFNTLEGAATNQSSNSNGLMGAGIGLGMGVGIGSAYGNELNLIAKQINTKEIKKCTKCNSEIENNNRFCPSCGYDTKNDDKIADTKNIIICSKCKQSLTAKTKFCPECGKVYNPCYYCGADLQEGSTKCEICGKLAPKHCTKCNTAITDEKIKFCPECGETLQKKCNRCGVTLELSTKFCPECGDKL